MDVLLIRNRDVFNSILEYDVSTGPLKEVAASSVSEGDVCKLANYIKLDDKYYGVYATVHGPCFFYQAHKFLLSDPAVTFEHVKGERQHYFKFTHNDDVLIDLHYDRWENIDIDSWSDENFIDFFIWLTKASSNQEFIKMWTKEKN